MTTSDARQLGRIQELRSEIDRTDDMIIKLLQYRERVSKDIGKIKANLGMPSYDLTRENDISAKYMESLHPIWGFSIAKAILGLKDFR